MLLAIDTCEKNCSASLVDMSGRLIARQSDTIERGHAEHILPMIDSMLLTQNDGQAPSSSPAYKAIKKLAVCTGPGSFTGLRVGLSVARGLALGLSADCVGLSALQILALQARDNSLEDTAPKTAHYAHSCLMGRGGQVFHEIYDISTTGSLPVSVYQAASRRCDEISALLQEFPGVLIGSGTRIFQETDAIRKSHICLDAPVDTSLLATTALSLNAKDYPAEPHYLRDADAAVGKPVFASKPPGFTPVAATSSAS